MSSLVVRFAVLAEPVDVLVGGADTSRTRDGAATADAFEPTAAGALDDDELAFDRLDAGRTGATGSIDDVVDNKRKAAGLRTVQGAEEDAAVHLERLLLG